MSGDLPKSTVCFRHLVIAGPSIGTSCDRGCCCANLASALARAAGGAAFSRSGATTDSTASAQLLRSRTTPSVFAFVSESAPGSSNSLVTASSGAPATLSSWSGVHRAKSTMVRSSRNITSSRVLIDTRCWYLKMLFWTNKQIDLRFDLPRIQFVCLIINSLIRIWEQESFHRWERRRMHHHYCYNKWNEIFKYNEHGRNLIFVGLIVLQWFSMSTKNN